MEIKQEALEHINRLKGNWNNPTEEAVERLAEHFDDPQPRFDARDRAALAHVLNLAIEILKQHEELS